MIFKRSCWRFIRTVLCARVRADGNIYTRHSQRLETVSKAWYCEKYHELLDYCMIIRIRHGLGPAQQSIACELSERRLNLYTVLAFCMDEVDHHKQ